jgi:hypothetical protein
MSQRGALKHCVLASAKVKPSPKRKMLNHGRNNTKTQPAVCIYNKVFIFGFLPCTVLHDTVSVP